LIWYGPKVFNRCHNYQGPHMSLLRAFNITVQRFQQTTHIYICVYMLVVTNIMLSHRNRMMIPNDLDVVNEYS
jgi:hypothetical protein